MRKSLPSIILTVFVLALFGCGIGEDSDIIGTNGIDDPSSQASGDGAAPDGTDGASTGDGSSTTDPDGNPDPIPGDYDPCADKVCGDVCQVCDPADEDCVETGEIKACNEAGECVSDTGDLCDEVDPEPEPYEPCAGKVCGDICTQCDPNDADCVETSEIKACNEAGECVSDTGDLCDEVEPEPYEPCGGKSCGDMCTECDPADMDCFETEVIKACNPEGECVPDTGDLCEDEEYDPCAGKSCGDMCTLCDPADLDCAETMEIKACNPAGECVSFTEDMCDEATACAESPLPADNFMADLEWAGGCGDMTLYAMPTDGTMEVVLNIWGVCTEAHASGSTLSRTYDLPDAGVQLNLNIGSNVSDATCDDVLEWENPMIVNHSIAASSGTLTVTVTPDGEATAWSTPAMATVTLTDAVFTDIDGCTSTVSSYTWTNVYVGWLAG